MSADVCVAYFGIKFEVNRDEVEGIELRSDKRIMAARQAGLMYHWGNFGGLEEKYFLFIGAQIALIGVENEKAIEISSDNLQNIIESTTLKLTEVGFKIAPSLYIQWQQDI